MVQGLLAVHALAVSLPFIAAAQAPTTFSHVDWELACDNTRTCRAAGYQAENEEAGVSVLLTRAAGPDQPVTAQVQLAHYGVDTAALPTQVRMTIDRRAIGAVRIAAESATGMLNPAQTSALLAAVPGKQTVAWSDGKTTWQLSNSGANAVLLKMDEFQGRLGTPGALVRKGNRPESEVLPALPKPVVLAAPIPKADAGSAPPLSSAARNALLAELAKTDEAKDCAQFPEVLNGEEQLDIHRLSADKLLVGARCWLAAYNSASTYWVVNDQPPYMPMAITADANVYENGKLMSEQKGRGLGDCWNNAEWTWDGRQFVQSAAYDTGMCRLIAPGGAWRLPTLVTTVKPIR
jgi:Protein of unknown function (DUF1176)